MSAVPFPVFSRGLFSFRTTVQLGEKTSSWVCSWHTAWPTREGGSSEDRAVSHRQPGTNKCPKLGWLD